MTAKDDAIAATGGNRFSTSWLVREAVKAANPQITADIDAFKRDIRDQDAGTLKLLDTRVATLEQLGIQTGLSASMIDVLIRSEIGDRRVADQRAQVAEQRAHETKIARIPMWAEAVKILGGLLVGFFLGRVS